MQHPLDQKTDAVIEHWWKEEGAVVLTITVLCSEVSGHPPNPIRGLAERVNEPSQLEGL